MRSNKQRVSLRVAVMKGSDKSSTEEAALFYQEESARMYGE